LALPTDVANELDAITGEVDPGFKPTGEGYHAKLHNDANEEINAVATELGVNPSGAQADVAARLAAMDLVLAAAGTSITAAQVAIEAEKTRAEAAEATKAALAHTHSQYDPYDLLPYVLPMGLWPGTTIGWTAKRQYFLRFTVARKRVFKFLRSAVAVVGTGEDKADAGIYVVNGAKLERLGSNGGVKISTTPVAVKAIEFSPVTCEPGNVYFASMGFETITGTPQLAGILNNNGLYGDIGGTSLANRIQLFRNESFPLPSVVESFGAGTPVPWMVPSES
jgi:hypothetical protein